MKITFISLTEEEVINRDHCDLFAIEINGEKVFCVYDGELEDNRLSRNFNDIYKLQEIIFKVYMAGKNGEQLKIENIKVEEY